MVTQRPMAALVDTFVAAAQRHPARPAVRAGGAFVSYGDLLALAEGLAGVLVSEGGAMGGKGQRCGVLGRRSASFYASVVGSMLASRVYVPLNPRFPAARNTAMLEAAGAAALIVDGKCAEQAREVLAARPTPMLVLLPDDDTVPAALGSLPQHRFVCRPAIDKSRAEGIRSALSRIDGAYLLFTSGSTGKPKGVLVSQGNGLTYVDNVMDRYRPTPDDRFSQVFDPTFDLSIHDMFLCWAAGACLYAAPDSGTIGLYSYIRKNELTFWFSVPSTAAFMERYGMLKAGVFPSLRWSLFCGEALPSRVAQSWHRAAPTAALENLYGPTEATIAFTAHRFDPVTAPTDDSVVSIGRPLPGQHVAVIGDDDRPVAKGEVGELCLGGSQVTPGYWRRPDLTEARFAVPKGVHNRVRWYRTGDLAAVDDDGAVRFLGRVDNQVKIRGYRVELQEIEGVVRAAAQTSLVAVVPLREADGLAVGLAVFTSGSQADPAAVQAACEARLPEYMVPSRIEDIADWPVNANGKTDYGVLERRLEGQNDTDVDRRQRHAG